MEDKCAYCGTPIVKVHHPADRVTVWESTVTQLEVSRRFYCPKRLWGQWHGLPGAHVPVNR